MTKSQHWDEPFDDVEAMVRAAGQYVGVSDDLRPRVLEAARLCCGEQRAQRCIRQVAVFVLLLAFFTAMGREELDDRQPRLSGLLVAAGFDELFSPVASRTTRSGDGDWRMIDAFTELRRQQAQVLRLEI